MIPYLVVTLIVYLVALYVEKNYKDKRMIVPCLFIIILTSIFAGVRNNIIGTDVNVYIVPIVKAMPKYGLIKTYHSTNIEIGFLVFAWLVSKISSLVPVFLFLIQVVITTLVVKFAFDNKEKMSFSNVILFYMTFFFPLSLNFIRQSIALAICLYSSKFIYTKNWKMFLVCVVIAIQFHFSAIAFSLIYINYWFVNNDKKYAFINKYIVVGLLLLFMIFFKEIITVGIGWGVFPSKYYNYVDKYYLDKIDIQYKLYFFKLIYAIFAVIYASRIEDKRIKKNTISLIIYDMTIYMVGFKIMYAERVSYYFSLLAYIYAFSWNNNERLEKIDKIAIKAMLILYFLVMYVYIGIGEIIPYRTFWG